MITIVATATIIIVAVIIKTIRTTIMITTIKHFPAHDALDTCKASLVSPEH